ncbi:transposase [Streptomyces sp. LN500]|uniref:transposase n=1 Tax=unclassified Streptomyces TaxID=2593676 RepID=UPI0037172AD8
MAEYQNIRTGRHCAFVLHAHLVFATKYRHQLFKDAHLTRMEEIMRAVCESAPAYVRGLIALLERKNCWTPTEGTAGPGCEDRSGPMSVGGSTVRGQRNPA